MKDKKIWLILSLACILSGTFLSAVGRLLGGIPGFYLDRTGIHTSRENAENTSAVYQDAMELEPFDSVELNIAYTDVVFVPSDRYAVDYRITGTGTEPVCRMENGRLSFRESSSYSSDSRIWFLYADPGLDYVREPAPGHDQVKIEFPSDSAFSEILIRMECGDLELPDLYADTLDIKNMYGNVTLSSCSGKDLKVHMSSGDLSLGSIHTEQAEIRNEYGEVQIDRVSGRKLSADQSSGSFLAGCLDVADIHLENEYGTVRAGLPEDPAAYGYDLHTEYGVICINGRTLKESYEEDGVSYLSEGTGGKSIVIFCERGDIMIEPAL